MALKCLLERVRNDVKRANAVRERNKLLTKNDFFSALSVRRRNKKHSKTRPDIQFKELMFID